MKKLLLIISAVLISCFLFGCTQNNDAKIGELNNAALDKLNSGDCNGAIEGYTQLLELSPNNIHGLEGRGLAKVTCGDYLGAIQDFDAYVLVEPNYDGIYLHRGDAKFAASDYPNAIQDYTKFISMEENNTNESFHATTYTLAYAYDKRGRAYHYADNEAGAKSDLDKANELDPNFLGYDHTKTTTTGWDD
ncbi:MAG: hypothetical protein WC308_03180 [archaeon]